MIQIALLDIQQFQKAFSAFWHVRLFSQKKCSREQLYNHYVKYFLALVHSVRLFGSPVFSRWILNFWRLTSSSVSFLTRFWYVLRKKCQTVFNVFPVWIIASMSVVVFILEVTDSGFLLTFTCFGCLKIWACLQWERHIYLLLSKSINIAQFRTTKHL